MRVLRPPSVGKRSFPTVLSKKGNQFRALQGCRWIARKKGEGQFLPSGERDGCCVNERIEGLSKLVTQTV